MSGAGTGSGEQYAKQSNQRCGHLGRTGDQPSLHFVAHMDAFSPPPPRLAVYIAASRRAASPSSRNLIAWSRRDSACLRYGESGLKPTGDSSRKATFSKFVTYARRRARNHTSSTVVTAPVRAAIASAASATHRPMRVASVTASSTAAIAVTVRPTASRAATTATSSRPGGR